LILVTLGTQDKSFKRLLEAIDNLIEKKIIKEEVIVQAGSTKYKTKNMQIFDLISQDKLDELRKKASLIITHAGVGSILDSIKLNKKVIAVARLKEYKEHTNNHQKEILNSFSELGYILKVDDMLDLEEVYLKVTDFKPKEYISNTENFQKLIESHIDKFLS
jgi:UDP-N-acetylglucosamine transferase subunit ALG13